MERHDLGAIVAMTGVDDYISDGETVLKASNGHHWVSRDELGLLPVSQADLGHVQMGCITGSGCMTGKSDRAPFAF